MRHLLRLSGTLCALLGVLLMLVSFTPLVSWLVAGMAVDWFEGDADVLVVLGGSMLVDGTGPQATLGYDSYLRCSYASWMLRRYRYSYVVLSGPDGLAENMARYLASQTEGRPHLLIENSARTTFENAEFVKNILDRLGNLPAHPTIAILTSDYHTRRARLVFERQGMLVRVIPVPDVAKRLHFPAQRWGAFLALADEFMKDGLYKLQGKI
jgi:uncharacterized SAM-binding protein YcdF (DUF218 family)